MYKKNVFANKLRLAISRERMNSRQYFYHEKKKKTSLQNILMVIFFSICLLLYLPVIIKAINYLHFRKTRKSNCSIALLCN